jgi:two-component system, LytTR family, sensor kinase
MLYWVLFISLLMLFFAIMASVPGFEKIAADKSTAFIFWIKLMTGFAVIPALISFYIFYTYLFDRFLSKKKFIRFSLSGLLISIIAALIGALAESNSFLFGPRYLLGDGIDSAFSILAVMSLVALLNGVTGTFIKGFITWYNDIKLKEELLKKNYETELNLIKSQLNPHFLFNTLNNIDILIEKDKVKASEYFKKLSDILRFMLYETKTEKIPVSKELTYIEKYIDLQNLRTSNPAFVAFSIKGNPGNHSIEPLVFIPFIENAFKHAENRRQVHGIRIHFEFTGNEITFTCSNSFSLISATHKAEGGLGNELMAKRLKLLYPGRHSLTISKENNRYTVNLIIHENNDLHHS